MSTPVLLDRSYNQYEKIYATESESRPGLIYYVGRTHQNDWACSCPAWIFHTPRKDCKHIRETRRFFDNPLDITRATMTDTRQADLKIRAERALDEKPGRAKFIEL